jgi:class 3 adenylate cyclase/TolB-like protein
MDGQKHRQLAAVMFTDIKGFTAMMQQDEEVATRMRDTHRSIFEEQTVKFNGRILQYFGDGTLSMFDSAVDAVHCARELQVGWRKANLDVRIGIHMGDIVVYENEDVVGDSVNVASRIESLGEPGSVLLSDKVYNEIRNHQEFEVRKLGTFPLKNVSYEPQIYALVDIELVVPSSSQLKKKSISSPKSRRRNSLLIAVMTVFVVISSYWIFTNYGQGNGDSTDIQYVKLAVMPFKIINDTDGSDYLSAGITEDIIGRLGRIPGLRVMSSRSTLKFKSGNRSWKEIGDQLKVGYVIDGNIQYFPEQLKVNIYLVDLESEVNLWTEVFEGTIQESYSLQNEVSGTVAQSLDLTYLASRGDESNSVDSASQIHYYRGLWYLQQGVYENAVSSFKLATQASKQNRDAMFKSIETQYLMAISDSTILIELENDNSLGMFSNVNEESDRLDYLLAWSDYFEGNINAALSSLLELEDYFHSSAKYYLLRGLVYNKLGQEDKYSEQFELVKELEPGLIDLLAVR